MEQTYRFGSVVLIPTVRVGCAIALVRPVRVRRAITTSLSIVAVWVTAITGILVVRHDGLRYKSSAGSIVRAPLLCFRW